MDDLSLAFSYLSGCSYNLLRSPYPFPVLCSWFSLLLTRFFLLGWGRGWRPHPFQWQKLRVLHPRLPPPSRAESCFREVVLANGMGTDPSFSGSRWLRRGRYLLQPLISHLPPRCQWSRSHGNPRLRRQGHHQSGSPSNCTE